jgi:hypothetical protein
VRFRGDGRFRSQASNDRMTVAVSAPAAHASSTKPIRNLLIVHTPDAEDISDFLEVKRRIEQRAQDIEVRIATNGARNSVTMRWQVSRPSLVFSPCAIQEFQPKGGTVYQGVRFTKLEQIERLARQSLPVPPTAELTRDLAPDPAQWGRYVVAKPLRGGSGQDIRLARTADVAARYAELTRNGARAMMIQPYIEHAENGLPTEYRVLTLFGSVLYAARNSWGMPRRPLDEIACDPSGIIASNDKQFGRVRTVWNDAEVIALGERAHAAFPNCAVLGVDVLRDADTGKLYLIEVNPLGYTWHFSSSLAKNTFATDHVRDLYAQFGALDRVAQLLVEKVRAEAA